MKLAFVAAANSPHTIKWANALLAKGHQVTLFSLPEHKDSFQELNAQIETNSLPFSAAQGGYKKNAKQLATYLANGSFGAVVAFGADTYGQLAAKSKAENVLLVSTGTDIYNAKKNGTAGIVKKSIAYAAVVCATAANVGTKMKELYKKEKAFFVTPFGVDMAEFNKKPVQHGSEACIGSVKFLEPGNGVESVIDAFNRYLQNAGQPCKLKIVGDGSLESELKRKVESMGIGEHVEFAGYVKNADMPDVMNAMDVVVELPPEECFGVSNVEAMACEIPVVASDTFGASEYILNGVTGYMVKPGNIDACADRIGDLLKNPDARARMGASCREDVLSLYNLSDCVEKFELALKAVTA